LLLCGRIHLTTRMLIVLRQAYNNPGGAVHLFRFYLTVGTQFPWTGHDTNNQTENWQQQAQLGDELDPDNLDTMNASNFAPEDGPNQQ
jgi:hypothetical protein